VSTSSRTSGFAISSDLGFDPQPTLRGELVEVRPLRASDFDALYSAARDPLIWEQHPDDRSQGDVFGRFFADHLATGAALAVLDARTRRVIGTSRYHGFDPVRSEVEIGWTFLARAYWGGRYNGELKRLMLAHAFRFVETVVFVVAPGNIRSQRAVEKLGAVRSGTRYDDVRGERLVFVLGRR
jgi:RimJ/RimL family protein N-acetyltransferase